MAMGASEAAGCRQGIGQDIGQGVGQAVAIEAAWGWRGMMRRVQHGWTICLLVKESAHKAPALQTGFMH